RRGGATRRGWCSRSRSSRWSRSSPAARTPTSTATTRSARTACPRRRSGTTASARCSISATMARSSPSPSAAADTSGTRDWWLRTAPVLQAPRPVFRALRDDSAQAAADRAEPVLLVILLAGAVGVLSTSTAGRLMDDPDYDGLLVAVWTFIGGSLYG